MIYHLLQSGDSYFITWQLIEGIVTDVEVLVRQYITYECHLATGADSESFVTREWSFNEIGEIHLFSLADGDFVFIKKEDSNVSVFGKSVYLLYLKQFYWVILMKKDCLSPKCT